MLLSVGSDWAPKTRALSELKSTYRTGTWDSSLSLPPPSVLLASSTQSSRTTTSQIQLGISVWLSVLSLQRSTRPLFPSLKPWDNPPLQGQCLQPSTQHSCQQGSDWSNGCRPRRPGPSRVARNGASHPRALSRAVPPCCAQLLAEHRAGSRMRTPAAPQRKPFAFLSKVCSNRTSAILPAFKT